MESHGQRTSIAGGSSLCFLARACTAAAAAMLLAACAAPFQRIPEAQWHTEPEASTGLVFLLFPSGGGWGGQFAQIYLEDAYGNDEYLSTLFPGTHMAQQLDPGEYYFMVVGETMDMMRATVQAGRTYHAAIGTYFGVNFSFRMTDYGHYTFKPINDPDDPRLPKWIATSAEVVPTTKGQKQGAAHARRLAKMKPIYRPKWEAKDDPQHLYVPTPHRAAEAQ